jgi:hypothetical protein
MPTPKPQIRSLFATPVCVHFLSIAAEMNPELRQVVLDKAQGATGPRGQGWRSTPDFEAWGGQHAQTLFRVLRELADSLTSTRTGGRVTLDWIVQGSAVVRQSGDHQEIAARPGPMWSGVYYVDDGYAKSDDAALGGECEFADPRGVLPAMAAPQLAFRIPGGQAAGRSELIRPQSGMILLYPSWQPRGERRCDGPAPRVAIEFDVAAPPHP